VGLEYAIHGCPVASVLFGKFASSCASEMISSDCKLLLTTEAALVLFEWSPEVVVVSSDRRSRASLGSGVVLGNVAPQLGPFVRVNFREALQ